MDVLPQVEQLDHEDLVDLQRAVAQLLGAREYAPSQEDVDIVTERYNHYLVCPEEVVGEQDIVNYGSPKT